MSTRFLRTPGRWRRGELGALLLATLVGSCNYGFKGGGGFPEHIRSIFIRPLENDTDRLDLNQPFEQMLRDRVPRSLGVQVRAESLADAILTARITRYDDVAQDVRFDPAGGPASTPVNQVQISVTVRIVDVRENTVLWEGQSLTGQAQYQPGGGGNDRQAQLKAMDMLIQRILDGAQSQW